MYNDGVPSRQVWQLPDISPEDFNPTANKGYFFWDKEKGFTLNHSEIVVTNNCMYSWYNYRPSSDEERDILIKMGQWGSAPIK